MSEMTVVDEPPVADAEAAEQPRYQVIRKRKRRKAEGRPQRWNRAHLILLLAILALGLAIIYFGPSLGVPSHRPR